MTKDAVAALLAMQDGVISRRQLRQLGIADAEIAKRLRRREWARVHPGVFVEHTGPPTWRQLAFAAVLYYWPAALAGSSALHAAGVRGYEPAEGAPIEVCVDRTRTVRRRVGIRLRQVVRFDSLCQANTSPPRQRVEHALLDVAARKRKLDRSVAVLADGVQARVTTAPRLRTALEQRPRLRHRAVIRSVLAEVDAGVRSVLEHRYLAWVERAHGLPVAQRQRRVRVEGASTYRDVDHVEYGVTVELDGRLAHEGALQGWHDMSRDLHAVVHGTVTLRVGWRHVLEPCRLARCVATVLRARGWPGQIRPCGPDCAAFSTPGAEDAAQIS